MSMFKHKREEKEPVVQAAAPEQPEPSRPAPPRPPMRLNLARGADGRIRPADQTDIGDMWAHQERVRLNKAIEADKLKAEKKKSRKERWSRVKAGITKKHKNIVPAVKVVPKAPQTPQAAKEIVVSLSVPKVRLPKLPAFKRLPKKRAVQLGAVVLVIMIFAASFSLYPDSNPKKAEKDTSKSEVASQSIKRETPKFGTLLPEGKKIEDLGGWARVSPPKAAPTFAFLDKIDGVAIRVSQQELPKDLQTSTYAKVEEVAKQFAANERISVGDSTAYVGTSIKGPQSVVFVKDNLLVLISSDAKITSAHWGEYIGSLR